MYSYDIVVGIGVTKKEIVAYSKKQKLKKEFTKWVEEDTRIYEVLNEQDGIFAYNSNAPGGLLMLKEFTDEWKSWELLIHEISHIVQYMMTQKLMEGEDEARAYLTEWLFRSIRRKLQGIE